MAFFSIIVPTFNSARTIAFCLKSILNQSFSNFEVLIMDGASADDTVTIARSFSNDRIRIYSQKDRGVYDAMNKGIKLAKGEYLYFLGSDDALYSTDVLEKVAALVDNFDVVYGNVYSTRFGGLYDGEFSETKIITKNICHQAIFYKKTVFNIVGNYNRKYSLMADWDLNLRWFLSTKIKHKFIDLTVADFADGGVSSTNLDVPFITIRHWKYHLLRKKQLSFSDKLKIIRSELNEAVTNKRRRNLLTVILQIPSFFL